jgi:hypothetical protein
MVVNLLAGAGFLYLATQDRKGRQAITAMGVRHLLLLQGLPVEPPPGAPEGFDPEDETPFVIDMGGGESTRTISKKLLEIYFKAYVPAPAGASPPTPGADPAFPASAVPLATDIPVTNQVAEVKRVQGVLKAALAKDGLTSVDKLGMLRNWLLFQAENYETRLAYVKLSARATAAGPKSEDQLKADIAALEKILEERFASAIAKPKVTDGPLSAPAADGAAPTEKDKVAKSAAWRAGVPLDETQRRMNIAHLLIHLDPDVAWQKRVLATIGLRRYVKAISVQVLRFEDMIAEVEGHIASDQAAYAKEETVMREQATQSAERAKAIAELRFSYVELKNAAVDAVNREQTQLKDLSDQLTKVKNEVDELLVKQTNIEKQLFEIQREVGLTLEDVYRLEQLLDSTERERFGLPPRVGP